MTTTFRCNDAEACALGQKQCPMPTACGLHQIQKPAQAEQEAWHASLDEGRYQAAPVAVEVPDERAAFDDFFRKRNGLHPDTDTTMRSDAAEPWKYWQARAALAATPAAAAPVVLPEPDAQTQRAEGINQVVKMLQNRADAYADEHLSTDPDTGATEGSEAHIEYWNWLLELVDDVRALLAGVSAPAAHSYERDAALDQAREAMAFALSSHGITLTSNPPQDAWVSRGVSNKLREAISAISAAKGELK